MKSSLAALRGPRPMPVVGWRGNMLRFFGDPIGYMDPLPRAFGSVVPFADGGAGPVLIRSAAERSTLFGFGPACNQAVLGQMAVYHSTRVPGPPEAKSFHRLLSGLFDMNDDRHRQHRRLLQPAFHKKRIEGYRDIMVELTARMIDGFRPGEARDLTMDFQRLTLDVANKALFGLDPSPGVYSIGERIQKVVELSMSPATMIPINLPKTPRRRLIDESAALEAEIRAVIAQKRAAGVDGTDVLSTLLATRDEDGTTLSDDELLGHLFLLFFAGHDTTKSTLAWTLFLLSQHPRILAALVDEIRGALGGGAPSVEQLGQMPLLDRVLKESLRLFTPAPFTPRITVAETSLEGRDLPVGTEVILSYYHTHRNPDLYPDPLRFSPRRWEGFTPAQYEYVPFGGGARMCIGASFATMEAKIALSMLLQRYRFDLKPGAPVDRKATIVLSPKHGMPMIPRAVGTGGGAGEQVRGDVHEMVDLRGAAQAEA
ncbi:MAG: cytochrome P450 [Minicystis sp.]